MKKTLVVGLDAACWEYVDPLLQSGSLPVLKQLMDSGIWGTMHTTMPPWTPAAWTSIVTGKNPGKHGVFDMLHRRPGTYEFSLSNADVRRGTPFWARLNEHGVKVGLVNVLYTYPPDAVEGFVVCGFGTPNNATRITHPPELMDELVGKYGSYEPTVDTKVLRMGTPEEILEAEGKHQEIQTRIALEYARQFDVDVLVINLMLPDHANHRIAEMDQVTKAYAQSDVHLGTLIDGYEPDNVLLFSDHGSNRLKGNFLLGAWLNDQGYLKYIENAHKERRTALNWILLQWLQEYRGWSGLGENIARFLIREGLRISPLWFQRASLRKLEPNVPFAWDHVHYSDQIDYAQSRVFPGSAYSGLIYLNLVGRNPDGMIPIQDRKSLLSEISEKLFEIEAPDTGQPLFSHIYTSDQLYEGPLLDHAPDLILDAYDSGWNLQMGKYNPLSEKRPGKYFVARENARRDSGWHSKEGVFVFAGADFDLGSSPIEGHVMDIPATLLHMYDVPIPEDYDGRVLSGLYSSEYKNKPARHQPGDSTAITPERDLYTTEEAEILSDHLRALGYL